MTLVQGIPEGGCKRRLSIVCSVSNAQRSRLGKEVCVLFGRKRYKFRSSSVRTGARGSGGEQVQYVYGETVVFPQDVLTHVPFHFTTIVAIGTLETRLKTALVS